MGRHAAPVAKRRVTAPVVAAAVALLAATVLIGGPGTIAFLNDSAAQPTQQIAAGGLAVQVGKTTEWVSTGAGSGSVVATSTEGLIPGLRDQRITFTITNDPASAVYGTLTGTLSAPKTSTWTSLESKGLIHSTTAGSAGCQVGTATSTGTTVSFPIMSSAPLAPGASCTVSITLSIPATGSSGQDAAMTLKSTRLAAIADFALAATLTQTARQGIS